MHARSARATALASRPAARAPAARGPCRCSSSRRSPSRPHFCSPGTSCSSGTGAGSARRRAASGSSTACGRRGSCGGCGGGQARRRTHARNAQQQRARAICTHPASKMVTPYSTMTFSAHRWQYVCGHALQRTLCLRRLPHLRAKRNAQGKRREMWRRRLKSSNLVPDDKAPARQSAIW